MDELTYPADVRVETEDLRAETDISGFNPMEGLEEEQEPEQQEVEQEVQEPQQPPQTGLPQQRDLGNPHARARIAARDARLYKQRFEQLWNWIQEQQKAAAAQEQEQELPPFDEAPIDHLQAKTQLLEKQLQEKQFLEQKQRENEYIMQTLSQGGTAIQEFNQASNGVYEKAVQHVANVRLNDLLESNPNLTLPEAERYLALEAQKKIFEWTRMGINPAFQFMDEAVRLGFNWQVYENGTQGVVQQGNDQARREIQAQRKRDNAARTISNMPGKSPKRPIQNRDPLKMQDDEFKDVLKILEAERGGARRAKITMQDFFQAQSN